MNLSNQELKALEKAAQVTFPGEYREWLRAYPNELAAALYSDDPEFGGPKDFEFLADAKRLTQLNRQMRKMWPKSDYADTPLPESYFLIGEDGCGNLFAIDTANFKGCPVFEFEHEEGHWLRRAASLDDFAKQLLQTAAKLRTK